MVRKSSLPCFSCLGSQTLNLFGPLDWRQFDDLSGQLFFPLYCVWPFFCWYSQHGLTFFSGSLSMSWPFSKVVATWNIIYVAITGQTFLDNSESMLDAHAFRLFLELLISFIVIIIIIFYWYFFILFSLFWNELT